MIKLQALGLVDRPHLDHGFGTAVTALGTAIIGGRCCIELIHGELKTVPIPESSAGLPVLQKI